MTRRLLRTLLFVSACLGCSSGLCVVAQEAERPTPTAPSLASSPRSSTSSVPPPAAAPSAAAGEELDYATQRTEIAGAPIIGGNSDIGIEFGAVFTATHFQSGTVPYNWNTDVVLAGSLKGGPNGAELAQQNYLMQLDMPDAIPGYLRFTVTGSFQRTVNYGYFGMNESVVVRSADNPRKYQFDQREALLRTLSRVPLAQPYLLLISANLRYVEPDAYAGSQLSTDAAAGEVRGLRTLGLASLGAGVAYDTRDVEIFPERGGFHQVGVKGVYAVPLSAAVRYLEVGAVFAGYKRLAGPVILAMRGLLDAQMGHVPFYDMALGGIFQVDEMPGGSGAIRGVPIGRYRGLVKVIGNVELRARVARFSLFGVKFRVGGDVFFDAGRSFHDYHFKVTRHESLLQWGAGAGPYLQWGQALVFRVDVAYSPDAAANGGFPLGIYVVQGVLF